MQKKKIGIFAVLFVLSLCIGIFILHTMQKPDIVADNKQALTIEDGVDINKENEEEENYTEIPVYKTITVSSKNPNVYFGNPETNNVFFKYKVYLKPENNDTGNQEINSELILYDNDAVIKPGRAFEVNLKEILNPGKYKVIVDISTYDMETQTQCNGATQEADLTVLN